MGLNRLALLPGLRRLGPIKLSAACVLLWLAASSPAAAAQLRGGVQRATGVSWRSFDPKTGRKISAVTAAKAWPEDDKTYRVQRPQVVLYGTEYKIYVTSEGGTVVVEDRRSISCALEGDVTVRVADPGKTVVKIDKLEWVAADRVLRSDSPVQVMRTDLTVKGVGMELRPEEGKKELRFIQIKHDMEAQISPKASTSAIFSSVTGTSERKTDAGDKGPPMFISSKGPMTINRDTNIITFEENVEARRGPFTIRCDKLTMSFDPEANKVKDILARGSVRAFDGENGASGDALSWDALSGLVEIVGSPAKTWRSAATVSSRIIWFSQKDGKALWTGRAHIYAPPEGPALLKRFGGARQ